MLTSHASKLFHSTTIGAKYVVELLSFSWDKNLENAACNLYIAAIKIATYKMYQ